MIDSFNPPNYGQVTVFSSKLSEPKAKELNVVQCPICSMYFPGEVIERHASECIIE